MNQPQQHRLDYLTKQRTQEQKARAAATRRMHQERDARTGRFTKAQQERKNKQLLKHAVIFACYVLAFFAIVTLAAFGIGR